MEMIKMAVSNVDGVDVEKIWCHVDRLREMPPRSPITGSNQPRVNKKPSAIALDNHACVAKNAKRNRHAREWYIHAIVAINSSVLRAKRYDGHSTPAFRMRS